MGVRWFSRVVWQFGGLPVVVCVWVFFFFGGGYSRGFD